MRRTHRWASEHEGRKERLCLLLTFDSKCSSLGLPGAPSGRAWRGAESCGSRSSHLGLGEACQASSLATLVGSGSWNVLEMQLFNSDAWMPFELSARQQESQNFDTGSANPIREVQRISHTGSATSSAFQVYSMAKVLVSMESSCRSHTITSFSTQEDLEKHLKDLMEGADVEQARDV